MEKDQVKVKVYLCKGRKVILMGSLGDHFGEVMDIENGVRFTSYGYPIAFPEIGWIKRTTIYGEFEPKEGDTDGWG